jgi:hypothetical protein
MTTPPPLLMAGGGTPRCAAPTPVRNPPRGQPAIGPNVCTMIKQINDLGQNECYDMHAMDDNDDDDLYRSIQVGNQGPHAAAARVSHLEPHVDRPPNGRLPAGQFLLRHRRLHLVRPRVEGPPAGAVRWDVGGGGCCDSCQSWAGGRGGGTDTGHWLIDGSITRPSSPNPSIVHTS